MSDLNVKEKARENDVLMPKFQHIVGLIVRLAKVDIIDINGDLRRVREIMLSLKKERKNLEIEVALQRKQLDNLEEIMNVLDCVGEENSMRT